jgi:hypothetical protein
MADLILETIESPDGQVRIVIVRRADGRYSYRACSKFGEGEHRKGDWVWPEGYAEEPGWGPPGPYCGIYDSAQTAKWEALGNVDWIADAQPRN